MQLSGDSCGGTRVTFVGCQATNNHGKNKDDYNKDKNASSHSSYDVESWTTNLKGVGYIRGVW